MARLNQQTEDDEIVVKEVEPFRFAERDRKVREIVASMIDSD